MSDLTDEIKAAIAYADAVDAWDTPTSYVQRSSDNMGLIYKVNANARIELQPTAARGLSDEELEDEIGLALHTVRKQMRDHADAIEGRLHAEISKLREDVERLQKQIDAANVVPIGRGRSDAA